MLLCFGERFPLRLLVNDCISAKHAVGPVPSDFHCDSLGNASRNQIPGGSPAKVMEEPIRHARLFAGLGPCFAEIPYGLPVPMETAPISDAYTLRGERDELKYLSTETTGGTAFLAK